MMETIVKRFLHDGKEVFDGPVWGMTTLSMGSMRFRWNEVNENRNLFLKNLCGSKRKAAFLELIHSKTVYDISGENELFNKQGDGIITQNKCLVPVVTVADCVPIYVYDTKSGTFGALHSGWKGTGIVGEAISMIEKKYGSSPEDICVAIGPHIGDCCYNITSERAEYFCNNFGSACVKKIDDDNWALSLTKANLSVLEKCGIPSENIIVYDPCTCCYTENETHLFGSFRRQTLSLPEDLPLEKRMLKFTVQAAFCIWN